MSSTPDRPAEEASASSAPKQIKLEADEPESEPPAVIKETFRRPRCKNRPKDELAPQRPKTVYQRVIAVLRHRLGMSNPELQSDIKGMAAALKSEWDKIPKFEKDKAQKMYEAELEVWKLKFAEYKKTQHFKDFFEIKQDWVDAQKRKKLCKKLNKDMPKRPMTSFSLFASDVRDRVAPGCAGPADVARKVAEEWHVLDQEQKNDYIQKSKQLSKAWKAEFTAYKRTEAWKSYCQENAKLQAKQLLKKLMRTKMANAPKKPSGAYGLFYSETMPLVLEENKGTAVSELRKIVQQKWHECPPTRREEFETEANRLREEYKKQVAEFKRSLSYRHYMEAQAKVKENEQCGLQNGRFDKPPSPFALFVEDHKQKVEPGLDPQEVRKALMSKYMKASMKEKKKYEEQAKALKKRWTEEMRAKKERDGCQSVQRRQVRNNTFQSEAQRILRLTYLSSAPKKPPGNSFKLFVHETTSGTPLPKEESERRRVVDSLKKEWAKTDLATKYRYAVCVKESKAKWKQDVREFMSSDKWLEYTRECKRLRVSVQSIFPSKNKQRGEEQRGAQKLTLPERPQGMPFIPLRPMELFKKTKMNVSKDNKAVQALWRKMSDKQKKVFQDQTRELRDKYKVDMQRFRKSDEGREYLARVKEVSSVNRLIRAKNTFLGEMPKKPKEALGRFIEAKKEEVSNENAGVNERELRKILVSKWEALDEAGKSPFEKQAQAEKEEYKKKMVEFKKSDSWQQYMQHKVRIGGRKGRGGRGGGRRSGRRTRFGQTAQQLKESRERANSSKKRKNGTASSSRQQQPFP